MANLHAPERQPGESFDDYKARRKASQAATKEMRAVGKNGGINSRKSLRDKMRANGRLRGTYGAGLLQPQRMRNQKRMETLHKLRDEDGAYTLVGQSRKLLTSQPRRKWAAGVSAVWWPGIRGVRGF